MLLESEICFVPLKAANTNKVQSYLFQHSTCSPPCRKLVDHIVTAGHFRGTLLAVRR